MNKIVSVSFLFLFFQMYSENNSITLATWNIRRKGKEISDEFLWDNRKADVFETILMKIKPDILCLQEPIQEQIQDFFAFFPDYAYIGAPRYAQASFFNVWHWISQPFATDEYNPIFYKKNRFECVESGVFNINPGFVFFGSGWVPRICTWALLKDIITNKELYVFNTHLDNQFANARISGLLQVKSNIELRLHKEAPVVLLGDFNMPEKDFKDSLQESDLIFAKEVAQQKNDSEFTHYSWKEVKQKGFEFANKTYIDHVLIVKSLQNSIQNFSVLKLSKWQTSDHCPVMVTIKL